MLGSGRGGYSFLRRMGQQNTDHRERFGRRSPTASAGFADVCAPACGCSETTAGSVESPTVDVKAPPPPTQSPASSLSIGNYVVDISQGQGESRVILLVRVRPVDGARRWYVCVWYLTDFALTRSAWGSEH